MCSTSKLSTTSKLGADECSRRRRQPFPPHDDSSSTSREQVTSTLNVEQPAFALKKAVDTDEGCPGGTLLDLPVKVLAPEPQVPWVLGNQTTAVDRPPPEVLGKILESRHNSDRDLISATQVCGRWRSTLLSAPLLWTEVVFGDPDRAFAYLDRPKGTPLCVSIEGSALQHQTTGASTVEICPGLVG
ncbi:hypothetical protein BDM02DRAFT_1377998 [Thelephora ganbajun]|uniref:Uncharacterized protein n=1 Tax=Thelephora ganbajun TaxID=370292 RepID=A0ACB6ZLG3_THEGA|nr:hypothetical protein BDM02DRAFT_1377998 [Thelephora ganbajun]